MKSIDTIDDLTVEKLCVRAETTTDLLTEILHRADLRFRMPEPPGSESPTESHSLGGDGFSVFLTTIEDEADDG